MAIYADSGTRLTQRRYVEVEAAILPSGFIAPKAILWSDGRRFEVERVLSCRCETLGGLWCYEVSVRGRIRRLWRQDGSFFVVVASDGTPHDGKPPKMDVHDLHRRYGYRA